MRPRLALLLGMLTAIIVTEIVWVRVNLDAFEPVLSASLLLFQLAIAVTVIAVLRNLVGVKSFGVFGPAIIAIGMTGANLLMGMTIYVDVFIVAMVTSMAMQSLGLTASHRVAIVITVTAVTIMILELVGEVFHTHQLEAALLFPVLITSWLGDRFVTQVRELDWVEPSKRLAGTFFVVVVAYAAMAYEPLARAVALTPESWGLIILVNVLLAMRTDVRLLERHRFRRLLDEIEDPDDLLGINIRNREVIARYNPRDLFPSISKARMKVAFHQLGVPAPSTYAIVDERGDLAHAREAMAGRDSFVIKPSNGFGGEGILVVRRDGSGPDSYVARGRRYTLDDLVRHIMLILDSHFSKGWSDTAIIEQVVESDPRIAPFHAGGVPDIRVIVLEGFPIMAMARLPTRESQGTANLHKGAIGMGLTISDGEGVNPYWRGHGGSVERHPDTGAVLRELRIPDWGRVLEVAVYAQAASRLGYAGVDVVLDRSGPMVLEVNKRPGLEIQSTNLAGLLRRIRFVESRLHSHRFDPPAEKVRLARQWDRERWWA